MIPLRSRLTIIVDERPGAAGRRGVVLILVLGMLALLALVGIAFVTLSTQARISSRHFAQSLLRPDPQDLMYLRSLATGPGHVEPALRDSRPQPADETCMATILAGTDSLRERTRRAVPVGSISRSTILRPGGAV